MYHWLIRSAQQSELSLGCQPSTVTPSLSYLMIISTAIFGAYVTSPFSDPSHDAQFRFYQNYGIICAFGVGFLMMLLFATEFNTGSAFDSAVTLFKHSKGAQSVGPANVRRDEEKAESSAPANESAPKQRKASSGKKKPALPDIFTWHHVQYVVPVSGGSERRLLDNVSGYVAPGKLTALMGESGAGKVIVILLLNVAVD